MLSRKPEKEANYRTMKHFIPRDKLSKKARRKLDSQKRAVWDFCPATRTIKSKKEYNRKRQSRADWNDQTDGIFAQKRISACLA